MKINHSGSRLITVNILFFMILIIIALFFILSKVYEVGNELKTIINEDISLTKKLTKITEYQLEQAISFERADRFGSPVDQTESQHNSFNTATNSFKKNGQLINNEIKDSEALLNRLINTSVNKISKDKSKHLKKRLILLKNEHTEYEHHANIVFAQLLKNEATLSSIERVEVEEDELDKAFENFLEDVENFTLEATQRAANHEQYIIYLLLTLVIAVIIFGVLLIAKIKGIFGIVETARQEIEVLHQQTQESIEYASIIQHALLPNENILSQHVQDFFVLWQPRDIVGGDIYLIKEINHQEVIIMLIDCTGHGVPGAFVTMLVKAIEHQATSAIEHASSINPAAILSQFNQRFKNLLQQEKFDSKSNVGFDGIILHMNTSNQTATFAGANTPLFIIQNDQLRVIKGDKHSIGYIKSNTEYEFTNHSIDISSETKIYITTDGFTDQTGGEKGFPYGNKKFKQLIQDISNKPFSKQKECLIETLLKYENKRKDDVSIIGFLV